jgi:deoxyribodipyrimidine photo-lyase
MRDVEESLKALSIPFFMEEGEPEQMLPAFVERHKISYLVTDFSPLRLGRQWRQTVLHIFFVGTELTFVLLQVGERISATASLHEVDAHNIVPAWIASTKQEVGARTLRPKIHSMLHGAPFYRYAQ